MMERQLLYHYTSFESFKSIINSRSLWLTDFMNSNDSEEVIRAFKNLWSDIKPNLEKIFENNDKALQTLEIADLQMKTEIQSVLTKESDMKPYGVCFSVNRDLSENWNEYGNHGKGIAIGFDNNLLKGINHEMPHPNALLQNAIGWNQVYYQNKHMNDEFFNLFKAIIEKGDKSAWIIIRTTLKHYSAFIKNPSYKDEREVRIAYYPDQSHDYKHATCKLEELKNDPIPHCTLLWKGLDCIREIIIGTNCSAENNEIVQLLEAQGIDSRNISIYRSSYPYRESKNRIK